MKNEITFEGKVGKDPELRYTRSQSPVCNFSICNENKKGYKTWMNIVVWGSLAEQIKVHLKKGHKTIVVGSIGVRSWEKNGRKNYITEIVAREVDLPTQMNDYNKQHGNRAEDGYQPDDDDRPF